MQGMFFFGHCDIEGSESAPSYENQPSPVQSQCFNFVQKYSGY